MARHDREDPHSLEEQLAWLDAIKENEEAPTSVVATAVDDTVASPYPKDPWLAAANETDPAALSRASGSTAEEWKQAAEVSGAFTLPPAAPERSGGEEGAASGTGDEGFLEPLRPLPRQEAAEPPPSPAPTPSDTSQAVSPPVPSSVSPSVSAEESSEVASPDAVPPMPPAEFESAFGTVPPLRLGERGLFEPPEPQEAAQPAGSPSTTAEDLSPAASLRLPEEEPGAQEQNQWSSWSPPAPATGPTSPTNPTNPSLPSEWSLTPPTSPGVSEGTSPEVPAGTDPGGPETGERTPYQARRRLTEPQPPAPPAAPVAPAPQQPERPPAAPTFSSAPAQHSTRRARKPASAVPDLSGRPNADSLDPDSLLRGRRNGPSGGWRKLVYKASAGWIKPGEPAVVRRRRELIARARIPVASGHHRVAVLSLKGGVGKTTTTVGLGSTLAQIRGDRVIAVDANPDRGTLSDKVELETSATVRDMLNERAQIKRYVDIRAFTSQAPSRLEILASDRDPSVSEAFSAGDYQAVAQVLENFYSICITDCGTGLLHSAMSGVLGLADQLVLVSSPSVDGARAASATLDWLEAHHYEDLVRNANVVLCSVRPRSKSTVDLDKLEAHFAARCREVVRVPYDPHLEEGAEIDLDRLQEATRDAYLRLAASVGDGFAPVPTTVVH
ncbi:AAA family ATPase [Spongiactinospora sp. 9N601]|uniref:MinD/ParA family ATP-binding protein n=1 Tax=Spongiactinospora sp. 9N601 TaxID=3375149 RepID=UPI00379EFCCD